MEQLISLVPVHSAVKNLSINRSYLTGKGGKRQGEKNQGRPNDRPLELWVECDRFFKTCSEQGIL